MNCPLCGRPAENGHTHLACIDAIPDEKVREQTLRAEMLRRERENGNGREALNRPAASALSDALERLEEYQETGLTPEEIKRLQIGYAMQYESLTFLLSEANEVKASHMRSILRAEKEGRLVVLPCKVGDTIYYAREGCPIVEPLKVRTFFVGDPTRRGEILHLHMIRTDKFDVSMDALGKTVFLTREEADAALEGGGESK